MTLNGGHGKPIEILLVEDNEDDAYLTIKALRDGRLRNQVHQVWDGEAAIHFLRREGPYANVPRPDLVLLDLHLPKKDGQEVLAEIKDDSDLKRIPVVILTTSDEPEDILQAYNRHVNCYLTKPVEMEQFIALVRKIQDFWLTIVKLPAA